MNTLRAHRVLLASVRVDAAAYQFKGGGDAMGVTDRLAAVTTWDVVAGAASPLLLHRTARGLFVVDGHQRLGLAVRCEVQAVNAVVLPASVTIERARRIGARLNLQQGTGTALDVGKLLRTTPLIPAERALLPADAISGEVIRLGEALARLGDNAFLRVVNGQRSRELYVGNEAGSDEYRETEPAKLLQLVGGLADDLEGEALKQLPRW